MTGKPVTVDHVKVKAVLVGRQIKDSQQYNKSHRVKSQRALVLGERCWDTGTNNEWLDCYITGIGKQNRCYQVVFEDTGMSLRRTRSHLRPRRPDFPHISERFLQQNATSSQNSVLSGREGKNQANNQETLVLSGPPHNLEQDTAVDFISDTPAETAVTFNDNPVAETRYIPLRLCDTPQEPRPPPAAISIDLMTSATDAIPRLEPTEQQEEYHDNVPDTGSSADSSAADTSGTLESSPGSSSTMGMGKSCRKCLWENLAGNVCGKILREILAGKFCGKCLWENLAGNSCRKILWEILAGQGGGEKGNLRKAVIGGNLAFEIG